MADRPKLQSPQPGSDGRVADFLDEYREVLAEAIAERSDGVSAKPQQWDRLTAEHCLQALSAAGLRVTSLTPEQAVLLERAVHGDFGEDDFVAMGKAVAELRRLSGIRDG